QDGRTLTRPPAAGVPGPTEIRNSVSIRPGHVGRNEAGGAVVLAELASHHGHVGSDRCHLTLPTALRVASAKAVEVNARDHLIERVAGSEREPLRQVSR